MLTLIERTKTEKLYALRAIEEHLRIQLMNVRAEIRELQLAGVKQSAPVTTTSPTPEPAQPAIVTNEEDIKVVWETPLTGYTLDDTGIRRTFTVQRWDDMRPNAVIELTTTDGKVISSAWQTVAIRKNSHFIAIRDGFNAIGTLALEVGILENFTDIEIESLNNWVSTVCDSYEFDNHNDEQNYILGLIERLTDAVVYKVAKAVLVFN